MPNEKTRVKDASIIYKQYYNALAPNVQGFLQEYTDITGKTLTLTSGRRPAGRAGNAGSKSKHVKGEAFDISATHTEDYAYLMNTPEGLGLLVKYNLGIIDETDPAIMEKTGATGAHFHVGTDSRYSKKVKERYANIDNIAPVYSYKQLIETGQPITQDMKDMGHFEGDGHTHGLEVEQSYDMANILPLQEFSTKELEKSIIGAEKEEKSEARNELKEAQAEKTREKQIEQEFAKVFQASEEENQYLAQYAKGQQNNGENIPQIGEINVQTSLPQMPSIFQELKQE